LSGPSHLAETRLAAEAASRFACWIPKRQRARLGFDESAILKIGGWKTSSVFRRYNIVD